MRNNILLSYFRVHWLSGLVGELGCSGKRVEREGGELLGDFESECSVLSLAASDLNLAAIERSAQEEMGVRGK